METEPRTISTSEIELQNFLEPFRSSESRNSYTAAVIIEDVDAKKVLATWPMMPIRSWSRPPGGPDGSQSWQWDWLWKGVKVDYREMAVRAGLAEQPARSKFEMLRAARLVYPDGTISKPARLVLEAYVQENLPKPPRVRGPKEK